jgi:hypothetical protein
MKSYGTNFFSHAQKDSERLSSFIFLSLQDFQVKRQLPDVSKTGWWEHISKATKHLLQGGTYWWQRWDPFPFE